MSALTKMLSIDKNLSLLAISNSLSNGATFILLIGLSHYLSKENFGALTISASVILQLSFLLEFGTGLSLVKWYNSTDAVSRKADYIIAAWCIRMVSCALFAAFCYPIFLGLQITLLATIDSLVIACCLLAVVVMTWWNFLRSRNQAIQDFRAYSLSLLVLAIIRVTGVSIAWLYCSKEEMLLASIFVIYVLAPIMGALLNLIYRPRGRQVHCQGLTVKILPALKQLLSYGRWVFASAILFPLVSSIPLWTMGAGRHLGEAGAFGIGIYFAGAIAPVREAVKIYFFPRVMKFESAEQSHAYMQRILAKMYLAIPIVLFITAATVFAEEYLNGDKYNNSSFIIFLMVSTQVITMFSSLFGALLHRINMPEYDVYINILRVFISAVLSLFFVPKYGAVAAALISTFSILVGECLIYYLVKRSLHLVKIERR